MFATRSPTSRGPGMIILDTNVVSELMRQSPEPGVVSWVDAFAISDVFITAAMAAELLYGLARMPEGRRRREVDAMVAGMLTEDFRGQILPFDAPAARHYAEIVVTRELAGRPITMADAQIAAICRDRSAGLATRNVNDFADTGIEVVNPWDSASS